MKKQKLTDDFGFFSSLIDYYEAKRSRAISTIKLYVQEPTGIGEHSDIQSELEKWTKELADSDESIFVLNKFFEV